MAPRSVLLIAGLLALAGTPLAAQEREDAAFSEAARRYWRVLQARPRRGSAFDLWYRHHARAGRAEELLEQVRARRREAPGDEGLRILEALLLERSGRPAEALAALGVAPRGYAALLQGQLQAGLGRSEQAVAAFRRALEGDLGPDERLLATRQLVRLLARTGDVRGAVAVLEGLERRRPEEREVLLDLTEVLAHELPAEQAVARLEAVLPLAADRPDRRVRLQVRIARRLAEAGRRDEAVRRLGGLLDEVEPGSWLSRLVHARIEELFHRGGDGAGLINWYEARVAERPGEPAAWRRLARHQLAAGATASAVRSLERALELVPGSVELHDALVDALLAAGRQKDAIAQARKRCELHPTPAGWLRLGDLELAHADTPVPRVVRERVRNAWLRAAAEDPRSGESAVRAARRFRDAASRAHTDEDLRIVFEHEAERLFREAIGREPESRLLLEELGSFLHATRRREDALKLWRSGTEARPSSPAAWSRLAEVLARHGETTAALEAAGKAARLPPPAFERQDRLVALHLEADRVEEAAAALDRLQELADGPRELRAALARRVAAAEALGRLADEVARLARRASSGDATAEDHWYRGLLLRATGRDALAVARLRAALREGPQHVPLLEDLAEALEAAGEVHEAARVQYEIADLDPRAAPGALRRLVELEQRRGRTAAATAAAEELVRVAPRDSRAWLLRARVALAAGRHDEAAALLREALGERPRATELRLELARVLAAAREREAARQEAWQVFEEAATRTRAEDALELLAGLHPDGDREALAARLVRAGRRRAAPGIRVAVAETLDRMGARDAARTVLSGLRPAEVEDPELVRTCAEIAERLEDWPAAVGFRERLVVLAPGRGSLAALAEVLRKSGDSEGAGAVSGRITPADDPAGLVLLLEERLEAGDAGGAADLLTWGLERFGRDWRLLWAGARVWWLQGARPTAAQALDALASGAEEPSTRPSGALDLLGGGRSAVLAGARDADEVALLQRAWKHVGRAVERLRETPPGSDLPAPPPLGSTAEAVARRGAGLLAAALADAEGRAATWTGAAREAAGDDVRAHVRLALVLSGAGLGEAAAASWDRVAELAPDHPLPRLAPFLAPFGHRPVADARRSDRAAQLDAAWAWLGARRPELQREVAGPMARGLAELGRGTEAERVAEQGIARAGSLAELASAIALPAELRSGELASRVVRRAAELVRDRRHVREPASFEGLLAGDLLRDLPAEDLEPLFDVLEGYLAALAARGPDPGYEAEPPAAPDGARLATAPFGGRPVDTLYRVFQQAGARGAAGRVAERLRDRAPSGEVPSLLAHAALVWWTRGPGAAAEVLEGRPADPWVGLVRSRGLAAAGRPVAAYEALAPLLGRSAHPAFEDERTRMLGRLLRGPPDSLVRPLLADLEHGAGARRLAPWFEGIAPSRGRALRPSPRAIVGAAGAAGELPRLRRAVGAALRGAGGRRAAALGVLVAVEGGGDAAPDALETWVARAGSGPAPSFWEASAVLDAALEHDATRARAAEVQVRFLRDYVQWMDRRRFDAELLTTLDALAATGRHQTAEDLLGWSLDQHSASLGGKPAEVLRRVLSRLEGLLPRLPDALTARALEELVRRVGGAWDGHPEPRVPAAQLVNGLRALVPRLPDEDRPRALAALLELAFPHGPEGPARLCLAAEGGEQARRSTVAGAIARLAAATGRRDELVAGWRRHPMAASPALELLLRAAGAR